MTGFWVLVMFPVSLIWNIRWETDPGVRSLYIAERSNDLMKSSTNDLVRILEKRALKPPPWYCGFLYPFYQMNSEKWSAEFEVTLSLLEKRLGAPSVYDCFLRMLMNPLTDQKQEEFARVLWLYTARGKDMGDIFSSIYVDENCGESCKHAIVGVLLMNKEKQPSLIPPIKSFLDANRGSIWFPTRDKAGRLYGSYSTEVNYLNLLGVSFEL
jgi:hypothetical protein